LLLLATKTFAQSYETAAEHLHMSRDLGGNIPEEHEEKLAKQNNCLIFSSCNSI